MSATGGRVYALMVGIDAYLAPVSALYGCVNDVTAIEAALRERLGDRLVARALHDSDATRDNVVEAFREHLGQAGEDDTALFVYAGHGSEEPASAEYAPLESTNRIQTLVLHDCGRRIDGKLRRALADKELALLLSEVAQTAGHVTVILDCCSSGGGTRDLSTRTRGWVPSAPAASDDRDLARDLAELSEARPVGDFLPGSLDALPQSGPTHVALAACASWEKAKETGDAGVARGAFSFALAESLQVLGEHATYRTLLATVASRLLRSVSDQHPELYPVEQGGIADQLFLGGDVAPQSARFSMSRGSDGWVIDAGVIHGIQPPTEGTAATLACTAPDGTAAGRVRVTDVGIGASGVEPIDWEPDDIAYDATLESAPLAPVGVVIGDGVPADVIELIGRTDAGAASPYVRVVAAASDAVTSLHLDVADGGSVRIVTSDAAPSTPDTIVDVSDESGHRELANTVERIARWEILRALAHPGSPIENAIELDLFDALDGETRRPSDRNSRPAGASRNLEYAESDGTLVPPKIFLEVRNTSDTDLWVALLALNDRFGSSTVLPACRLAAGHSVSALPHGAPTPIVLPDGRPVEPGASVTDWFKIISSEEQFDASSLILPPLARAAPATRDLGEIQRPLPWAAATIEVVTTVPS